MYFNSVELLKKLEGFELMEYIDSAGKKTIGIGHLLNASELLTSKIRIGGTYVDYSNGITAKQCNDLCRQDLESFCKAVDELVDVDLSQNEFDALVMFCFNIGIDAFKKSTLLKLLNQGDYKSVPEQLMRWTKAGGKQSNGLVNRRKAEIMLWNAE